MTAYDNLPAPAGDMPTMEERFALLREDYGHRLGQVMDDCLSDLLLPADQIELLNDAAQFFTFLMAVKIVEATRQPITSQNLMAAYWPMQKRLKDDVPGMLRQLAAAAHAAPRGHINDPI